MNDIIKVKLNEAGLIIYANRAKEMNKKFEENNIKYRYIISPERDDKGFVKFQLWELMNLYGKYLELTLTPPFEDNKIYFEDAVNESEDD